jgi:multiple sugar transport system ATP-binding protein
MTTVFVTHDQTEAIALADRIAVMERGELQQFGTPTDLKERPANLFVAGFIGEPAMNLLLARVGRDGAQSHAVAADGAIRIPLPADAGGLKDGEPVQLGLRPHRLTVGGAEIKGRVVANFWLGDQSHLAVDVMGARIVAATDGAIAAPMGSEVTLGAPPASVHLFDPRTGAALVHAGERA